MKLENMLSERRSSIIKKWRDVILATYPGDTQRFFRKEKDQFSNPVGHIIVKEIETLYDEVIKGENTDKISSCLDNIIRIRAIQDFKPSHALAFVLKLKKIVREELEGKFRENGLSGELEEFENKIDDLALLAFDIYSQCRQKIYEMRVNEVKNQVGRLLERANITCEIPEQEPDL
jgi:hypothetical protein